MNYEVKYFDGDLLIAKQREDIVFMVFDDSTGRFLRTTFSPRQNQYHVGIWNDFVNTIKSLDAEVK